MKDTERRQYDMLMRVRDFGNAHRGIFAGLPAARDAFQAVDAAVNELAAADLLKVSARAAARADRKKVARRRLIRLLVRVSQLARLLRARGRALPPFAMPRSSTDEGFLTLARQFARDAASLDVEFSGHGLGAHVIRRAAGAFESSVRDCVMNQANVIAARTRIHDLVRSARLEVRRLDLIVGSGLAPDNAIRAVWQQARRVERRRGPRSGNGAAEAVAA